MGLAPVKHHSMVTNVQRLLRAIKTQPAARIVTQPHGNGGGADKIVVCMWRTDRVVVDLDRREEDLVECLVGTNLRNNGSDQLTVPLGFRVHEWDWT